MIIDYSMFDYEVNKRYNANTVVSALATIEAARQPLVLWHVLLCDGSKAPTATFWQ